MDLKKYVISGLVILVTIAVYNSFLKALLPTSIRSMVGLG